MKKFASLLFITLLFFNTIAPVLSKTVSEKNDYFKIERTSRHLHSRLSKKYTGYDYSIKNIYKEPVKIESISLRDNASAKIAYLSIKRTGVRASAETLGTGLAFALPTLTVSLIASVVAVPFIIVGNTIGNIGAGQESRRFDKPAEAVLIQPKEEIKFKTMSLHLHPPIAFVTFINPITDEVMTLDLK